MQKSDLSGNTVKIDYNELKNVAYNAVAAQHRLMENYRHVCDDAFEQLFQEQYKKYPDPTLILHITIKATYNAEHLSQETKKYADAVAMLQVILGAINRSEVNVINLPYKGEENE